MGAEAYLPGEGRSLSALRHASAECWGCQSYKAATRTVLGEDRPEARALVAGEQPGDKEDLLETPFVGPAGRLLDQALDAAGLDREELYVTNAVKHFKWESWGKRRLHKRPTEREVRACRPWLMAEIDAVGPDAIVALGASSVPPRARLSRHPATRPQRGHVVAGPENVPVVATCTRRPSSGDAT